MIRTLHQRLQILGDLLAAHDSRLAAVESACLRHNRQLADQHERLGDLNEELDNLQHELRALREKADRG